MRNLLQLLIKYNNVLLFLVLELVAFALLVSNNDHHSATFSQNSSEIVGSMQEVVSDVKDYFQLKEDNEQLAAELAKIKSRSNDAFLLKIKDNYTTVRDTIYMQQYQYLNAKAINGTHNQTSNFITLNRGTSDGVRTDMGVIGPNGIVGFVNHASENYATVALVINKQFTSYVRVKESNYSGRLSWPGSDPEVAIMEKIPKHAELAVGDSIVTNGASGRFPENVNVGTIIDVKREAGGEYQYAQIKLATDFSRIYHVLIINNLLKEEQQALEALNVGEDQ